MAVTFGSTTIVSDSDGAYRGHVRMVRGAPNQEYTKRSFPRGSGVHETFIGSRDREVVLRVMYVTTSESTLVAAIEALQDTYYRTLVTSRGTFTNCRLASIQWGEAMHGHRSDNTGVTVLPDVVLTFEQVKVS